MHYCTAAISPGHATASSAAVASEISSLTERLNELTEGTVYRREMIAGTFNLLTLAT